jgi:hypothetical protein
MATTTPNFGWSVPTSTDLVKDGATAIELLGDSIDASLVDLKGGTTGQVLSKTSGTDMDFTWVTTDDVNAIQNAIVDAKGDLIGATAADTPARLAVGANGTVLTADSAEATGLKWVAPAGGGKVLQVINVVYSTAGATSSTTFADTGLTASITPSASTSKILVFINHNGAIKDYNNVYGQMRLVRGATTISSIGGVFGATNSSATNGIGTISTTYLDSPATTSSVTYKTQYACNPGSAEFRLQANVNGISSDSTITLMEIGA